MALAPFLFFLLPVRAISVVAVVAAGLKRSSETPTGKVIELLENLKIAIEGEGKSEAHAYNEFACFCKEQTAEKSSEMVRGKTGIDILSAKIEDDTATKAIKASDLQIAEAKLAAKTAELKETEVRCEKERAAYVASDVDLTKAISSLEKAIRSMGESKPAKNADLLSVRQFTAQSNPAVAEAMRLVDAGPQWRAAGAFLQLRRASDDPYDYMYHSHDILATLHKLIGEFEEKKKAADAEWEKTKTSCDETKTGLETVIRTTKGHISELQSKIEELTKTTAETRVALIRTSDELKDNKHYMTDLTSLCETRAKQWDQRSQMRADELDAIAKALDILHQNVTSTSEFSERAFLEVKSSDRASAGLQPPILLQHASAKSSEARVGIQKHVSTGEQQHRDKALEVLRREGQRLSSSALLSLATRASSDPFAKVKTLIQALVERLLAESTGEATKRRFCDTELGKAYQDRDFRYAEVLKISAEISELEAKIAELELEMGNLKDGLQNLADVHNESSIMRARDKSMNLMTLAQTKAGLKAVTEALAILKSFYKEAAKATALTQVRYSPVEEDTPGPGFEGAYVGKQAESKGVIGLLQVVKSDFERTIRATEAAEREDGAEFVRFDRATKVDQSGKSTKHELDDQDLETTKANLEETMADMQSNMDLLDQALKAVEDLRPMCIDNVMSYGERVAKREEEIEALKHALCVLDTNGVEEECS